GKDRVTVAEGVAVADIDGLIKVFCPHDAHDRTEYLLGSHPALRVHVLENRRPEKAVLRVVAHDLRLSSVEEHLGPFPDAEINVAEDACLLLGIANRPHLD